MTGTFPFLKSIGGHNTVEDLAIGIPATIGAAVAGPEILGALGGAGAGAATDVAAATPAIGGAAVGAPGAGAAAPIGFAGDVAATPTAGTFFGDTAFTGADAATGAATDPLAFSGTPVPYTGQTLGGGFPQVEGGTAGVMDFSPSSMSTQFGAVPTGGAATPATPATPAAVTDPAFTWGAAAVPGITASGAPITGGVVPPGAVAGGSTLGDLFGGATNFLAKNPLLTLGGLAVGGQLLGPTLANALGLNKVPGSQNLINTAQQAGGIAGSQAAIGQQMEQPLLTGQLPPDQAAAVAKATQDAISTVKGRYAALGLTGSTMEADAIANAQQNATVVAAQLETQMAQTGAQEVQSATQALGLEESIYNTILNATIQQDANLGNAISNFASAAALGTALGQAKTPAAA